MAKPPVLSTAKSSQMPALQTTKSSLELKKDKISYCHVSMISTFDIVTQKVFQYETNPTYSFLGIGLPFLAITS